MNKKTSWPASLFLVLVIGLMGFKDTGIFVRDFVGKGDSLDFSFKEGEQVDIIEEMDLDYLISKGGSKVEIPKDSIVKSTEADSTYKVKSDTLIKKNLTGSALRTLKKDELLELVSKDQGQAIFKSRDNIIGYVDLDDLEEVKADTLGMGVSKVNRILNNGKSSHKLVKGGPVKLKGLYNEKYIVVGMDNEEYLVDESDIQLKQSDKASRGLKMPAGDYNKSKADRIVAAARKELGKPYVSGDIGRRGYDCSGLTYAVYLETLNIRLPRTSTGQATVGRAVKKSDLEPGDLVFFRTTGRNIGHVGIYIGNGNMIHASTGRRSMIVASINSTYFRTRYVTARRVIN